MRGYVNIRGGGDVGGGGDGGVGAAYIGTACHWSTRRGGEAPRNFFLFYLFFTPFLPSYTESTPDSDSP